MSWRMRFFRHARVVLVVGVLHSADGGEGADDADVAVEARAEAVAGPEADARRSAQLGALQLVREQLG